jgi:DMSO/TMAO reductase YedYZ molybdopterin-dependent catalytic subunit
MKLPAPVAKVAHSISVWRDERLVEARHGERVAAVLGIALGVCFSVCFVTGLLSHLIQHPPSWLEWPSRPAGLYRVTQGVHVATGIAAVPLLFAKLWSVFPRLFTWPPARDVLHALERLSLLPLVGGAVFMLVTGVANIDLWYPWPFHFPAGHYAVAWITIGALVVHVGAKASITRRALRREEVPPADVAGRRRFLGLALGSSVGLVLVTAGQTFTPLRHLAVLAPRRGDIGVQGFPVNRTAVEARIEPAATSSDYRLRVEHSGDVLREFTVAELAALPQRSATLPISCVEGWSASVRWTGVPLRLVIDAAGARDPGAVEVVSLEERSRYRTSMVNSSVLADDDTLLALQVGGEPLALDHGYPVRLIAPNRPGVLQTKWVARLVVS